jgi:LysR family hydrogen peroxide-inducible transcriptional activator
MAISPHAFTLRQLQYVVAVADRRNFRKASESCAVSPPSLSAQIAQLEELLGVQLFDRDPHRVRLTSAGEALVEQARRVLNAADALVDVTRRFVDPLAGTLRLGIIPTLGPYLLPTLAPALRVHFPQLTVHWFEDRTRALVARLGSGELEAAVVALEADLGDLERLPLGSDPFFLASPTGHALSQSTGPVGVEVLDGERLLLLEEGHCLREQALSLCERVGASEGSFRATSLPTLAQMVASGVGLTLLPGVAANFEGKRAGLHLRSLEPEAGRTLALVWRRGTVLGAPLQRLGAVLKDAYLEAHPEGDSPMKSG